MSSSIPAGWNSAIFAPPVRGAGPVLPAPPAVPALLDGAPPASPSPVRAAIADAAARTGNSFDFLLAQARIESNLNPVARAGTSSARGLYQFTEGSWLGTLGRHGAEHGLGWAQDAISRGAARNPAQRAALLALRNDPTAASLMAGELANDNRAALTARLGRTPDHAELYLAHFLGSEGAGQMLDALATAPGSSAAALLPKAAAANRSIFYEAGGAPRSVAGVMDLLRAKVANAMTAPDSAGPVAGQAWAEGLGDVFTGADLPDGLQGLAVAQAPAPVGGPLAQEFAAGSRPLGAEAPPRTSMADTLRGAFGMADANTSAVPAHIREAYGRLAAFGM